MTDEQNAKKLFVAQGNPLRNAHLNWLGDYTPTAMAEAFKLSADSIIESCLGDHGFPDRFFYPVAYLYRHYLELEFKNIIHAGKQISPRPPCATNGWGHDLATLWVDARHVLTVIFSNDNSTALLPIDEAVSEIACIDPDGQSFRYYRDAKGNRNLSQAPRVVSLEHLQTRMDEIFQFLSGCSTGIEAILQQSHEQSRGGQDVVI